MTDPLPDAPSPDGAPHPSDPVPGAIHLGMRTYDGNPIAVGEREGGARTG